MTIQEKKAYLKRYIHINKQIRQLSQEKEEILELGTKITPTYSDMPRGTGIGDKIPKVVERLVEQQKRIDEKMDELFVLRTEIEKAIDTVKDDTLKLLLTYKYINGWTWEHIADEMNYSWRQIIRLHGMALDVIVCHI